MFLIPLISSTLWFLDINIDNNIISIILRFVNYFVKILTFNPKNRLSYLIIALSLSLIPAYRWSTVGHWPSQK